MGKNPGMPLQEPDFDSWYEIEEEMSNFDYSVDEGMEDALDEPKTFGRHNAWNFNGLVWKERGEHYYEAVYQYHSFQEVVGPADSLEALMSMVNDRYGKA